MVDDEAEELADGEAEQVLDEQLGDEPVAPEVKPAGVREDHEPRSRPDR